jgi:hypothetical protein
MRRRDFKVGLWRRRGAARPACGARAQGINDRGNRADSLIHFRTPCES